MRYMMMRFDTRDKKPKLYNIAILTALTVLLTVIMMLLKISSFPVYSLLTAVYLLTVMYMLMKAFIGQLQYNPYSYNSIYYSGFFLFVLVQLFILIGIFISWSKNPDAYPLIMIIHVFLGSAKNYMLITAPLLLLFAILLCISNVFLIRNEGFSFTNMLAFILAILLVCGEIFLYLFDFYVSGSLWDIIVHELVTNTFAAVYLYFECMLLGAVTVLAIVSHYEPEYNKDFMIVLGCGLRKDGTPLPLLKGRIDRALEFYQKQKKETGKELTFVCSGGQGSDEVISEGRSIGNYLREQGIPEERILLEEQSVNTFENMKYSKEKIMEKNPEGKIAFSTTAYHVFRSGLYARRNKMRAVGIAAKTKWYFWPNASVREFVGLLTAHKVKQAVALISMVVIYIVLTFIVYTG